MEWRMLRRHTAQAGTADATELHCDWACTTASRPVKARMEEAFMMDGLVSLMQMMEVTCRVGDLVSESLDVASVNSCRRGVLHTEKADVQDYIYDSS